MSMIPKKWKAGKADEDWKIEICQRDIAITDRLIKTLIHIICDAGSDTSKGIAQMRQYSGDQIITALLAYKKHSIDSIVAGKKLTCTDLVSVPTQDTPL